MQADVAQGGSGLWVVVVCNRTWAFAPLPRPEVQVEFELLPLTLPEEAGSEPALAGCAAAETSIDVAKAVPWPCPGTSEHREPGQAQRALRAPFLRHGARGLRTRVTHFSKREFSRGPPARTGLARARDPRSEPRELWDPSAAGFGLEEEGSVSFQGASPN